MMDFGKSKSNQLGQGSILMTTESLIMPPTHKDKIKHIIQQCMKLDIAIPAEFIDKYNKMIKEGID